MEAIVKRWGNSAGIIIPSETLKEISAREGDVINVEIRAKKRIDGFGACRGARPFKEEKEPHDEFW